MILERRVAQIAGGVVVLGLAVLFTATCPRQRALSPAVMQAPPVGWPAASAATAEACAELERLIFVLTSRIREQRGLIPFREDATLASVAREHSEDMLRRRYFEHNSPEGLAPAQRIHRGHRTLIGTSGENLWTGSGYGLEDLSSLAQAIVDDWMASRGHRENVLRLGFTHLGVGVAVAEGGQIRATQNFAAVYAYLYQPFPKLLSPGATVELAPHDVELIDGFTVAPRHVAFQADHTSEAVPQPLGDLQAPARPGQYQLQLYVPQGRAQHFLLIPGPIVEIQ